MVNTPPTSHTATVDVSTGPASTDGRKTVARRSEPVAMMEPMMMREKSRSQVYDQYQRVFRGLMHLGRQRANAADPRTGGQELLVHNWGNPASNAAWSLTWDQVRRARVVYERMYETAEHRTHGRHFRPLWCALCRPVDAAPVKES